MQRHGGWDQFDKVVYIGDGGNDLCPILRLRACVSLSLFPLCLSPHPSPHAHNVLPIPRSQDVALVRMYRELSRRIEDTSNVHVSDLKCQIVSWGGAWEVEKYFKEHL